MALKADYTEADKFTRLGKSNIHKSENKSKAIKEALKDENVKKQTMDFIFGKSEVNPLEKVK